jgi:hypothetical protein
MGLRPSKVDEDAKGRSNGINNLDRVFNGVVYPNFCDPESCELGEGSVGIAIQFGARDRRVAPYG